MTAAEEKEWGWTAGELHHCQERPICRNKGLHLSCQTQDLTQQLHFQHPFACQAGHLLSLVPGSSPIPRAVGTTCKRWVTQRDHGREGATSEAHRPESCDEGEMNRQCRKGRKGHPATSRGCKLPPHSSGCENVENSIGSFFSLPSCPKFLYRMCARKESEIHPA